MLPKARFISCVLGLSLTVTLAGCRTEPPEPAKPLAGSFAEKDAAESKLPLRMLDPDSLRNMSTLLAGMIAGEDLDEVDPVWAEHARFMDEAWTEIDRRLERMHRWAATQGVAAEDPTAPLLYPFGGPDLISALQFFPDASSYLLIGLEAPGHMPDPESFSAEILSVDLKRLRKPFNSFVDHGYFVRNEIDKDLSGGHFDGVLPIILICLVRSGQVPLSLEYIEIDPETYAIQPAGRESETTRAVVVRFVDAADAAAGAELGTLEPRAVYYFAQDLSNNGLFSDEPFSRLVQRQKAINVYMKSAEYLLHTDDFSTFRKLLLKKASTILQDDSGIPVRFLTSDTWDLRLFGRYSSVLAAYSHWLQDDLVAAYANGKSIGELDFTLGYSSKTDGGNLILGVRKDATEPSS